MGNQGIQYWGDTSNSQDGGEKRFQDDSCAPVTEGKKSRLDKTDYCSRSNFFKMDETDKTTGMSEHRVLDLISNKYIETYVNKINY